MSLLEFTGPGILGSVFVPCTLMDVATTNRPDGQGGVKEDYTEGAKFDALIEANTSTEAQIAGKKDARGLYTVVFQKGLPLRYHTVFRRDGDGATFRVTSPDPADSEAPDVSTVQIAKVTAERWDIPT